MQLKELGKKCREFRIKNGITIDEIAEQSNYSLWNVYKFEQGRVNNALILLAYLNLGLHLN